MSIFRFKQFEVSNSLSAMKLGTDSVLLGSCVPISFGMKKILDVGTGTGVVALMVAQRLSACGDDFQIEGIDIDAPSVQEASENFRNSPWRQNLYANLCALGANENSGYDLIVSNPPFFDNSLLNPDNRQSTARHTLSLSFRDLCAFASSRLSCAGILCMVLPKEVEKELFRVAASFSLFPFEEIDVKTTPQKTVKRIVISFSKEKKEDWHKKELMMMDGGSYTAQYRALMEPFLISLK